MFKYLTRFLKDERGAIAMYFALLTPVFLIIGAIVIDLSRYYSLNTQLQNYADAAALAGATELDRLPGSRAKALEAARNTLINSQDFAEDGRQISLAAGICPTSGALPDQGCVYFLWRLRPNDTDPIDHDVPTRAKDNSTDLAFDDSDARYIEVRINKRNMSDMMLNAVLEPNTKLSTGVVAVAGINDVICKIPGFFMCNPLEPSTGSGVELSAAEIAALNALRGTEFKTFMKQGGGGQSYVPGDWGLICPLGTGNCNVQDARNLLASSGGACFSLDDVTTKPGVTPLHVIAGINVRFDWYTNQATNGGGSANDWINLPGYYPALNVTQGSIKKSGGPGCTYNGVPNPPFTNAIALGRDIGCMGPPDTCATGVRMGSMNWQHIEYMRVNHGCNPTINPSCKPENWDGVTNFAPWPPRRYDIYRWEIENAADTATIVGGIVEPLQPIVAPTATTIEEGVVDNIGQAECANPALLPSGYLSGDDGVDYFPNWSDIDNITLLNDRRLLVVAVINCNAMNVNGIKVNGRFSFDPGQFAMHFLTEPMAATASESAIYTEWIGMVGPKTLDQLIKRVVQLYRRDPNLM